MSSYAKQAMELAEPWLQANPDKDDPFLRIPRKLRVDVKHEARVNKLYDDAKAALVDKKLTAEKHAEVQADIARVESLIEQTRKAEDDMESSMQLLERMVNGRQQAGHAKMGQETAQVVLGRWYLSWARDGYNVFELSQEFVAAMLLTDPREIEFDELKLPFRGILVTIPAGFATGAEGHAYTKIHIGELPHNHRKMLDVGNKVADTLRDFPPEDVKKFLEKYRDANNDLRAKYDDDPLGAHLLGGSQDLVLKPAVLIHASDGVNTLDTVVEAKDLTWKMCEALPDGITEPKDQEARRTLAQITFGLLAYLTATKDLVERDPIRKEKQRKALAEQKRVKHWDVGRTVKISPELVRVARSGAREVAFRIKHRFMVMGHYRNQAHGPKRAERKRIWIAPFEKGPEEGAKLVHTYKPEVSDGK